MGGIDKILKIAASVSKKATRLEENLDYLLEEEKLRLRLLKSDETVPSDDLYTTEDQQQIDDLAMKIKEQWTSLFMVRHLAILIDHMKYLLSDRIIGSLANVDKQISLLRLAISQREDTLRANKDMIAIDIQLDNTIFICKQIIELWQEVARLTPSEARKLSFTLDLGFVRHLTGMRDLDNKFIMDALRILRLEVKKQAALPPLQLKIPEVKADVPSSAMPKPSRLHMFSPLPPLAPKSEQPVGKKAGRDAFPARFPSLQGEGPLIVKGLSPLKERKPKIGKDKLREEEAREPSPLKGGPTKRRG